MTPDALRAHGTRRCTVGAAALDHVGLTVPDLDAAVTFFVRVLGAEVVSRDGPLVWDDGASRAGPTLLGVAMLRLPPDSVIELLRFAPPTSAGEPTKGDERGRAVPVPASAGHHLAIRVPDLDAAVQALEREPGVTIRGAPRTMPPGRARAGIRFVYARTPWGLALELVELEAAPPSAGR